MLDHRQISRIFPLPLIPSPVKGWLRPADYLITAIGFGLLLEIFGHGRHFEGRLAGKFDNAAAQGDLYLPFFPVHGCYEGLNPLQAVTRHGQVCIGQDDHEGLATETAHQIDFAQAASDGMAYIFQYFVTHDIAERHVDLFKIVQVEHGDGQGRVVALGPFDLFAKRLRMWRRLANPVRESVRDCFFSF